MALFSLRINCNEHPGMQVATLDIIVESEESARHNYLSFIVCILTSLL